MLFQLNMTILPYLDQIYNEIIKTWNGFVSDTNGRGSSQFAIRRHHLEYRFLGGFFFFRTEK